MDSLNELEEAIKAIEHLFDADRYPSFKPEFDLIVEFSRVGWGKPGMGAKSAQYLIERGIAHANEIASKDLDGFS